MRVSHHDVRPCVPIKARPTHVWNLNVNASITIKDTLSVVRDLIRSKAAEVYGSFVSLVCCLTVS